MDRTTKQQRAIIPKPPKKKIVKRPKGDAERKAKEVAEKMKKVIKKPKGDAERKQKVVEEKLAIRKALKKERQLDQDHVEEQEYLVKLVARNFAIQDLYKDIADHAETSDKPEAKKAVKKFNINDIDDWFNKSFRKDLARAKKKGLITPARTPFLHEFDLSKKITSKSNVIDLISQTNLWALKPSAKGTGTTRFGAILDPVFGLNDDFDKILKKNIKKYNKPAKEDLAYSWENVEFQDDR